MDSEIYNEATMVSIEKMSYNAIYEIRYSLLKAMMKNFMMNFLVL